MPGKPTVLLTAFGPFPDVPVNATRLIVPRIARAARAGICSRYGAKVHTACLPTEWRRGPERSEAAVRRLRPDLVLHFGVSSQATGFVIERFGARDCLAFPDCIGSLPADVARRGPARTRVSVPWEEIVRRLLQAGHPAAPSDNAGGYLCNAVLYHSLTLASNVRPRMVGFIHIPASLAGHGALGQVGEPIAPLSPAQAVAGGLQILETCLETLAA